MTSYIINFVLQKLKLPYNEDLLRLIYENSSSYKNCSLKISHSKPSYEQNKAKLKISNQTNVHESLQEHQLSGSLLDKLVY